MQTAIEECSTESKASPKTKQKNPQNRKRTKKKVSGQAYIFSSPQMTVSNRWPGWTRLVHRSGPGETRSEQIN